MIRFPIGPSRRRCDGVSRRDFLRVGGLGALALPALLRAEDGGSAALPGATAPNWVLSGRFGSPFGDYPAIGAVVSHELGYRGPMPPYFAVPRNPSFTWELGKSAFLGGRYESFKSGDPNDPNFKVQDLSVP